MEQEEEIRLQRMDAGMTDLAMNSSIPFAGVDLTNKSQENALAKLRASIQAQRELKTGRLAKVTNLNTGTGFILEPVKLELCVVPEITADNNTEFNAERYEQLCQKVDVLYHNFLVRKQGITDTLSIKAMDYQDVERFESALQELCAGVDEVLTESVKVRWT